MYDAEIFHNCKSEQLIIMEKMVSEKNYFINNVWNYLMRKELKDKAETRRFLRKKPKIITQIFI